MALDSKQKRGSAIGMTMPHRAWLAEPDGTLDATDRASLLKLCSAVTPAAPGGDVLISQERAFFRFTFGRFWGRTN